MKHLLSILALMLTLDRGVLYAELMTPAKDCPKSGRKVTFEFQRDSREPVRLRRWWVRRLGEDTAYANAKVRVWRKWRNAITVAEGLWTVTVRDGDNVLGIAMYVVSQRD
jgi:hypothetical protein